MQESLTLSLLELIIAGPFIFSACLSHNTYEQLMFIMLAKDKG